MKRTTLITLLSIISVLLALTLFAAFADGTDTRATNGYFEIYTSDPATGASPTYVETSSKELYSKFSEYISKGDTWIVLGSDVTLTLGSRYVFKNSLYVDLNGHKLTLPSATGDNALCPIGAQTQSVVFENGSLTTGGSKLLYPTTSATAAPNILFDGVTIDVTADFSDYRAGGTITFNECKINFLQNYKSGTSCNRFIFFGQYPGIGEITLNVINTEFYASPSFAWTDADGSIFNFGNKYGNKTVVNVTGSTFNFDGSNVKRVFLNGTTGVADIDISDSRIVANCPLLQCVASSVTDFNIGDGVAIKKAAHDSIINNANSTVNYPDGYVMAYHDDKIIEYVSPENAINVTYYNGAERLGERFTRVGAAPYWDVTLDTDGMLVYSDGVLSTAGTGYFSDASLGASVKEITGQTPVIYVGPGAGEPCAWAAFSSEAPSLDTLLTYSTDGSEIIGAVNNTSVKLIEAYRDVTLTHTGKPYALTRDLTIDAKGNTLNLSADNTDKAFNPQTGVTLTIKNATVISATARLVYPGAIPANVNTNIVFENVRINWTAVAMFDYRAGGSFVARQCEFNIDSNVTFAFNLLTRRENLTLDMSFEDCVINTDSRLATPFINLTAESTNCTVNLSFDGCTFNAPTGQPLVSNKSATSTLNVRINCSENSNPSYINSKVPLLASSYDKTTLTVGNGVYLGTSLEAGALQNVTPTFYGDARLVKSSAMGYGYTVTDKYASVTFVNGDMSTTELYEIGYVGTLDSSKTFAVVSVDGVDRIAEQLTAWYDADGNLISTFTPTDGMTLTGRSVMSGKYADWSIFAADGTEIIAHSLMDGYTDGVLPGNTFGILPEGGLLRLYNDVTLTLNSSGVQGITPAKDSVIDLGGQRLEMTDARFMCASVDGYGFTVKNGTVDVTKTGNNIHYANIGAKGHTVFENVTFVTRDRMLPFDIRGGGLYLTDCKFNGTSQLIALSSRYTVGAPIWVVIDGGEYKCADLLSVNGSQSGNPAPPYTPDIDVVINNTTAECGYLLSVAGKITDDSVINLKCNGVKIKSSCDAIFYLGVDCTVNIELDGSVFSHDPSVITMGYAPDSLAIPDGLAIVPSEDPDYPYAIDIPVILKWSLSLQSNLNLNFYLNKEGINFVRINGEDYPLSEMTEAGEKYLFALKSVGIDRVAEELEIEVGYGNGHTVTYKKSIVDYAKRVLESVNTDKSKRLVASAMNYIHALYLYQNSEGVSEISVPLALTELVNSDLYRAYLPTDATDIGNGTDLGNLKTAIKSARLNLDMKIKLRFDIQPGYNGTLVIGSETFEIVDGYNKKIGLPFAEVELDAFTLYDDVFSVTGVSNDGVSINGSYSLSTYLAAVRDDATRPARDLLDAIKLYSLCASEYKVENDMLNSFVYEKRGNVYVVIGATNVGGDILIPKIYNGLYVAEIGAYAFAGNTNITSVTIPDTVKTVGIGAFLGCTSLSKLTVEEGVEVIGARAFENTGISALVIPDSVVAIGLGALKGCDSLERITVPFVGAYRSDSNNYFGYIFGAPSYVANFEYVPASLKTVILSDNATRVPAYSFWGCSEITEIQLGTGVNTIGISAFNGCEMLTTIYIPKNVTSIPAAGFTYNSPFFGCSEDLVIVTEATDTASFGVYWDLVADGKRAALVTGKSLDEYNELYK